MNHTRDVVLLRYLMRQTEVMVSHTENNLKRQKHLHQIQQRQIVGLRMTWSDVTDPRCHAVGHNKTGTTTSLAIQTAARWLLKRWTTSAKM